MKINMTTSSGCAVIVEPRQHAALKFVIETAVQYLPPEWTIQLFHGTQNEAYAQRELKALIESGRLVLQKMPVANLTRVMYSQMFLTLEFWEKCLGEHILIFQTDSIFLPTSPHKLTDFFQWDYIGGPWWNRQGLDGGFSLRTKSSAIAAIQNMPPQTRRIVQKGDLHEDQYFSAYFRQHPKYRMAPIHEAQKFCVEGVYYEKPMAVHQTWTYKQSVGLPQYYKLVMSHPVLQQLLRLNNQPLPTLQQLTTRRVRSRSIHPRTGVMRKSVSRAKSLTARSRRRRR